jgi:hypothetical protein
MKALLSAVRNALGNRKSASMPVAMVAFLGPIGDRFILWGTICVFVLGIFYCTIRWILSQIIQPRPEDERLVMVLAMTLFILAVVIFLAIL